MVTPLVGINTSTHLLRARMLYLQNILNKSCHVWSENNKLIEKNHLQCEYMFKNKSGLYVDDNLLDSP